MKIGVAQIRPVKGDIGSNIEKHKHLIDLALSHGAEVLIFPELSITGYEPTLAKALAVEHNDSRFDQFQEISTSKGITLGIGVPTLQESGLCISMLIFQPQQPSKVYSKRYLHADEDPFFVSGQNFTHLPLQDTNLALAVCYEIYVPEHEQQMAGSAADIYIASEAKSVNGIDKAHQRLSGIASTYAMPVLMSNCLGLADGMECAGKSAIWHADGSLAAQLDGSREGILLLDTNTQEVVVKVLANNLLVQE